MASNGSSHGPTPALDLSPSSTPDSTPGDQRARKLQLRRARFRGIPVPAAQQIPSSSPPPSSDSLPSSSPTEQVRASGHLHAGMGPNDVLQEVPNGKSRRRLSRLRPISSLPAEPDRDDCYGDENLFHTPGMSDPHRRSSIPIKSHRSRVSQGAMAPRRSTSGIESSKYIEHLESQLAAYQTQLQSFTSPSQTHAQSTKLRALNSETQTLRHDLAEWESKFSERVEEQVEEQRILVDSLRAQVRALERSGTEQQNRIEELLQECSDSDANLRAVESVNYELERRLGVMSELLATSPNKIDLHATGIADSTSKRPRSIPPLQPNLGPAFRPFSPDRLKRLPRGHSVVGFVGRRDSRASDMSSLEHALSTSQEAFEYPGDRDLELACSPSATDANPDTSGRPVSWMRTRQPDGTTPSHQRAKPSRRMRRFYTGSTGPRALILPATTHAGSYPLSAPVLLPQTPCRTSRGDYTTNRHSMSDFPILKSPESPQSSPRPVHRRVATWDINDASSHRTPDMSPAAPSSLASALSPSTYDQVERERLKTLRALSSDGDCKDNLFDELSRARRESSLFSASRPGTRGAERARTPDEVDTSMTLYSEFPHGARDRSPSALQPLLRRQGSVLQLMNIICARTLDLYTMNARRMVHGAWTSTLLSRPVVEFRVWLIRLLMNGLHRKAFLQTPTAQQNTPSKASRKMLLASSPDASRSSIAGSPGDTEAGTISTFGSSAWSNTDAFSSSQQSPSIMSYPAGWLKFGVTLVFAVGIAIKDGPSSLFGSGDEDGDILRGLDKDTWKHS